MSPTLIFSIVMFTVYRLAAYGSYARDLLRSKKTIKIKSHLFACLLINSNNTKKIADRTRNRILYHRARNETRYQIDYVS